MSAADPRDVDEMIAWLRAHPDEPFRTSYSANRLLVGTRSDDGELMAWECVVTAHEWVLDRRRSRRGARGR